MGLAFTGFLDAMFDPDDTEQIATYAKSSAANDPSTLDQLWSQASGMVDKAKSMLGQYGQKPALLSENVCIHWETGNGLILNVTHLKVPLDQAITTVSWRGTYMPYNVLYFSRGTTVFKYDAESDTVLMHISYPMLFWWEGHIFAPTSADLYVGPVDNNTAPVSSADARPWQDPAWQDDGCHSCGRARAALRL